MLSRVMSFALRGLEGVPVEVETDINKGLVAYDLVGLPDAAVKESKERVRSAIKNSALRFPVSKITINFVKPRALADISMGSMPVTARSVPSSASSPKNTTPSVSDGSWSLALRMLTAMGRS